MSGGVESIDALRALAVAYCEAIHFARPQVFEEMCHEKFLMTAVTGSGGVTFWDKPGYLARVAAREPFPGAPAFDILGLDASGDIGRVHLCVNVPPRRFEDHLGFVRLDGAWKLITKVFRTVSGPDL